MNSNETQKKSSKKGFVIGGVVVGILVLIGISTASGRPQSVSQTTPQQEQTQAQRTATTQKYQYKVLSRTENKTVENVDVLVQPGETNAEAIAMEPIFRTLFTK